MSSHSFEHAIESDSAADPICEFYTHHPYPPPIDNLDRAREMWQNENVLPKPFVCEAVSIVAEMHRAEYNLFADRAVL